MRRLMAVFEEPDQVVEAARQVRGAGYAIADAFVPFAVHGLDEAMGLRRSRLTWVCFAAALTGGTLAMAFQLWTSVSSWPLNVGGKPFASVPAFLPITFELTVLTAALVSATTFFARSRLFPGKRAVALPRVTDDRFVLVVETDAPAAEALLRQAGAVEVAPLPEGGS